MLLTFKRRSFPRTDQTDHNLLCRCSTKTSAGKSFSWLGEGRASGGLCARGDNDHYHADLDLVVTTIVVMSLMISMKVCSAGGYCCNMGHQHCEWTIINVSSSPSSSSSSRTSAWSEPSSTGWKQWDCGPDKERGTSSFCFHCWHVKQVIEVITMMIFILSWRRLDGNNVGNVNNGVGGGNGDKS